MSNYSINKKVAIWLFLCAFMIILMMLIGALTRLTHSGLSIVEWKPITGIALPLDSKTWIIEFEKYKEFPEYNLINKHISLEEFKFLYILEYVHRLFARIIGFIFLIPFLYFLFTKKITKSFSIKLLLIFILGGLQGYIGWYMVKSGLIHANVSQYRLTLHLISAFLIYGIILWNGFVLWYGSKNCNSVSCPIRNSINFFCVLVFIQLLFGGLVAGTKAGFIYNEFPFMGNRLIPSDLITVKPEYLNLFENPTTIQFIHRILGFLLLIFIVFIYKKALKTSLSENIKKIILYIVMTLITQICLGILTLIYHVPISIALIHQFGAIILVSMLIYLNFILVFE